VPIGKELKSRPTALNGWGLGSDFGDREFFNGDWLKRPIRSLAERRAARNSMVARTTILTLSVGEFPPVNAFCSIPAKPVQKVLHLDYPNPGANRGLS